ncbi:uncharacterized protein P884DRAFT_209639 [Thermothelomyces heterothallicus CBS 202.75]|uniref:uncharacterized protein n=1 Tax=Thermothelomyces heterothallicus CBS 202.75 TaxID=1149848 RepID=UPI003741F863
MDQDDAASPSPTFSIGSSIDGPTILVCEAETIPDSRIINEGTAEIRARIRAVYDSGAPIFTKDAMRRAAQSFDRILEGSDETVPVTGLDGITIEFKFPHRVEDLLLGEANDESNFEYTMREPCLLYRTVHQLIGTAGYEDWEVNIVSAYLPFSIGYETTKRNKHTKEAIFPWPAVSQDQVEARLAAQRRKWQDSETCARLGALFAGRTAVPLPEAVVINKVVAFACSSMAWDLENGEGSVRSAAQHALVLGVAELLAQRRQRQQQQAGSVDDGRLNDEVVCYAQDPVYHPADKAVLSAAGVVVLDDPRAFLEVDETSVVVSPYPDIPVREVVADIARPAVMIWNRVTDELTTSPMTDPVSPRVRDMISQEYLELECPLDDEPFRDMAVYVRKT